MDSAEFKIDTREFERALVEYAKYSKSDVPKIINRAALDIVINAATNTPKANKEKIKKSLLDVSTITISPKTGKALKKARTSKTPSRLVYRIINARLRSKGKPELTGNEMSVVAKKFVNARLRSVGYIAFAGWQKAVLALGGRGFGAKGEVNAKSHAAKGTGSLATWLQPAKFMNNAKGADKVGFRALQDAINSRVTQMQAEIAKRMEQNAKR